MTQSFRFVAVDDTDERVKFTGGPWFRDVDYSSKRRFSRRISTPYRQAQHATNHSGTISFTYHGSDVVLAGSSHRVNVTNERWGTQELDPDWDCYLDGTLHPPNDPYGQDIGDGLALCDIQGVKDGIHTLTVKVKSKGRPFWMDHVRYLPSPQIASTLHNPTVVLDRDDPALELRGSWNPDDSTGYSRLNLDFTGTKLKIYGSFFQTYQPHGAYILDNGPEVEFSFPFTAFESWVSKRIMFESPTLTHGPHNIRIVLEEAGWPQFDRLLIEDGEVLKPNPNPPEIPDSDRSQKLPGPDIPATSHFPDASPSQTLPDPSSTSSPSAGTPRNSSSTSAADIVGAVFGVLIFLALGLFLLTRFIARWRKRRAISLPDDVPIVGEEVILDPFITLESVNRNDNPSSTVPIQSGTTTKDRLRMLSSPDNTAGSPSSSRGGLSSRDSNLATTSPNQSAGSPTPSHPLADPNSGVEVRVVASGDPFQDALQAAILVDVDITDAVPPMYSEFV
ncbi:hypothetical protein BKA70DRAFT_1334444 [Coprinopsis sp. MPI-PUGE-AT-0042]|nr:hypothetical protein BKA70DRAFT_1334444 [Coprinopsis sp. MPI-PUGE-AT-0042]